MQQKLAEHLPLHERGEYLQANCDNVEKLSYMKRFTEQELVEMKNRLSELSIIINDIEEEKKELVKNLTDNAKPIKTENKELLKNIKHKAVLVNEDCFKFIDQENNIVTFYNVVGDLVSSRPLLPSEMQKSLFALKSGTND